MLRRSTFEVRVNISTILPEELQFVEAVDFSPLKCVDAKYWGELAHLEFVGEIKAYKRWAVASKMMQHLHTLIEDGTEVVFYIEEKA